MTIPNPDHFFDQASRLVVPLSSGPPRQVDLRRAISAAYYGVFHFTLAALADEFAGVSQRTNPRYALVYRSVDHRTLKDVCAEALKQTPSQRYGHYAPADGFGADIQSFAASVIELQEKRHRADYNPASRFRISDANLAIFTARSAVHDFVQAAAERQRTFLTLLLCPPR